MIGCRKVLVIVFMSCHYLVSFGGNEQYLHSQLKFNYLTIDDGLSYNKVNSITRDGDGFVWFATNEGLNKYDGFTFKIFRNETNDSSTISNSFVIALLNDSQNRLWAGTFDGLNLYDPETYTFQHIQYNTGNFLGRVYALHEDKNKNIWVATQDGIAKIEQGKIVAEHFKPGAGFDAINEITYLRVDNENILWIGTLNDGLFTYNLDNGKKNRFKKNEDINSISGNWITKIFEDNEGKIWIGTNDNGLNCFEKETNNFKYIEIDENNQFSLRVRDIVQDKNGVIWIGTRAGLYQYEKARKKLIRYAYINHNISILKHNSIYDIYLDNQGMMWLGTYAGGVNYADFNQKRFIHYASKNNSSQYLNDNLVYSIYEDSSGDFWAGTEKGGLNHFNSKTGTFNYYRNIPSDPSSVNSNNVKSIIEGTEDGYLWVATYNGGLNYFNTITGKFKRFDVSKESPDKLNSANISTLFKDSGGDLWIGQSGLQIKRNNSNKFITIPIYKYGEHINRDVLVICIYEDKDKNIWIGSWGEGLLRYDRKKQVAYYSDIIVHNNIIYGFNQDKNGNLWICGERGLFCINNLNDTIYHYTEKDGLPANNVYIALDDPVGNLWISTASGLAKFVNAVNTPQTPLFKNYDVHDGLQSKQFRYGSYYKGKSGKLYFGGVNGLNVFDPLEIKENEYLPKVAITNLKIFNKDVAINDVIEGSIVLTQSIGTTNQLILNYKHYIFSLEFAALHFVNPEKNRYAFMLDGFDKDWNYTGIDKRSATYSNLPGGDYVFKVKATNNDGNWNNDYTSLKITVVPPFWETLWFKIVVALVVALLAFSVNVLRVINLTKQKQLLEKNVEIRTVELKEVNEQLVGQKEKITKSYNNIKILSEFGQKLTATLNFKEVNQMIFGYVSDLMDASNFGIAIYNQEYNSLDFHGLMEDGVPLPFFSSPLSDDTSCGAWCFNNQEVLFSNDFLHEYKKYINDIIIRTKIKPRSVIYHPLTVENKRIGIITVQSFNANAYSKYDLAIIKTLASYIAIALDNANNYREIIEKNKTLRFQTGELNETNTQLEERQQLIEEQAEELKAQAEELNERNQLLMESNKTKDRLFSIIAHDLKNPFSSILGFSELLTTRYSTLTEEKRLMFIENINTSTRLIYKLLENMLSWSRSQTDSIELKFESLDLKDIIENNIELLNNLADSKKTRIVTESKGKTKAYADKNTVNTVVRNLISNAIKFTTDGEIICKIKEDHEENRIYVSISDSGIGIEKERLDTIFDIEKSKSTKGTAGEQGTGLGLIICKEFIEKNKGRIYVESIEGKGSTFTFHLPVPEN